GVMGWRVEGGKGCPEWASITANQPGAVTLSLSKTDVSCHGGNDGSVTAPFGGGAAPYMIKIDAGAFAAAGPSPQTFSGLSAGSHTVTVKDANGCPQSASITVNEPTAVTLSLTRTDVSCNGGGDGSVTATFGGGTGPHKLTLDRRAVRRRRALPPTLHPVPRPHAH